MRRTMLVVAVCLSATLLLAQEKTMPQRNAEQKRTAVKMANLTPLKVNTGLWQMTQSVTWTGLPPQMDAMMKQAAPTHTYKSCVKPRNLSSNPWAEGSHDTCKWTALNSTGTDMEVQATGCDMGKDYGMTADIHGKIHVVDSEDGTGSMDITLTGNGQTMHGHATYTGKWVAASCPADMN